MKIVNPKLNVRNQLFLLVTSYFMLRPREETIWYYAHEQDKVKRLCNDMTELLEKKLARYLNEH